MTDFYSFNVEKTFKELNSSKDGLSSKEVNARLEKYGHNELEKGKKSTVMKIFLSQFKNALIVLLVFAGLLSLFLGERIESIAIFTIVLLNAVLGFIQEYKAEKAIEALEKISAPTAKVLRGGKEQEVPAKDLVPGDIMILEAGDIVAADSRIIEESSLQIDEASLTGESVPSKKFVQEIDKEVSVADQENMAFMGTVVTYGKGKCIVTGTGMKTEFGKIASSLQTTEEIKTPLQVKFERLAKQIGIAAVILIMIVLVSGTLQGTLTFGKMLLFALVLAVATIPSALPVIVTVGLSQGANDLAKKNMLIKKLPAAESLGAATIICSDKTGTITKNEMTITKIFSDDKSINVSGTGYKPEGNFYCNEKPVNPKEIWLLLDIGYICNNAKLTEEHKIIGDPTEGSLIVLAKKGGIKKEFMDKNFSVVEELPFDSERKMMSVIVNNHLNEKTEAFVKGAPDMLLEKCSKIIINGKIKALSSKEKKKLLDKNTEFAEQALRVLGMAYRDVSNLDTYNIENTEKDLIFVGLVGMIDPPREGVRQSISDCADAGIDVMMITGDYAVTAKAVSQEIGLFKEGDLILTGEEVEDMSDADLEKKIDKVRIIARALPIQKSRIVDILKKRGHIVAMTGDGVNDAPALKKADIGIAMGITGTDVAKEVSKAILTDDNFATIVNAIKEGRNIYNKMIKSAKYLLSCNSGEIFTSLIAILINFPLPLLPLQILLINVLTDTSPALGLGFESAEEGIMKKKPRDPKEKPITTPLFISIIIFGVIMSIGTLYLFMQYKSIDISKAQTIAFTTLVMFQMFAVMSSRSLGFDWKKLNPFSNVWLIGAVALSIIIQIAVIYWPPLQGIFGTVSIGIMDWMKILGISALGFVMMEISKVFIGFKKKEKSSGKTVVFE